MSGIVDWLLVFYIFCLEFSICFFVIMLLLAREGRHSRERSASDILTERLACRAKNDAAGLEEARLVAWACRRK